MGDPIDRVVAGTGPATQPDPEGLMDELQQVLVAARAEDDAGRPWALATIIGVSGSTYRRAGARLVVRDDNTWVGNLSGGCLEGEVLDVGGAAMDDGQPRRRLWDLTADDEAIWGWGLGCNGAMEVFISPSDRARAHLDLLEQGRSSGAPFRLVTVVGGDHASLGTTALLGADGTVHDHGSDHVDRDLVAAAAATTATSLVTLGDAEAFVEHHAPALRLLVCGAGHDAVPVVARGAAMGWEVVVVDDRRAFLDHDRFPGATAFRHVRPDDLDDLVVGSPEAARRTAAIVMTHNFLRDAAYLRALAPAGLGYLGMLGPATRLDRLVDHLDTEGVDVRPYRSEIHGPAGLDLGAEGPDEIAMAIVAEVLATVRGATGGPLRDKGGSIHDHSGPG